MVSLRLTIARRSRGTFAAAASTARIGRHTVSVAISASPLDVGPGRSRAICVFRNSSRRRWRTAATGCIYCNQVASVSELRSGSYNCRLLNRYRSRAAQAAMQSIKEPGKAEAQNRMQFPRPAANFSAVLSPAGYRRKWVRRYLRGTASRAPELPLPGTKALMRPTSRRPNSTSPAHSIAPKGISRRQASETLIIRLMSRQKAATTARLAARAKP